MNKNRPLKSKQSLQPIRRTVQDSITSLKNIVQPDSATPLNDKRALRFESLEERRVLSVTGFEGVDHSHDSGYITTDFDQSHFNFQQDDSITFLKVAVNGQEQELTPQENTLKLVAGDRVEVLEIGFNSTESNGVYAAEGYVNKIGDLTSASLIDYNDGRFSGGDRDFQANGGDGVIGGLANEWIVQSGWDRMTINLMHYTEEATEVDGRFFVNMQVGEPDFAFDTDHLDTILNQEITEGDEVDIPARWFNNLAGSYHNYAEVDIYHDCDPNTVVWAGATVGNASVDNSIEGLFVNTREDDPFTERWTPTEPGEYILKYYIDPEEHVSESNEANNVYEIRLTVLAKPAPTAIDDTFDVEDGSTVVDVLENDLPTQEAVTLYEEDFEAESQSELTWTTNPNGTDTATTGAWEATDPVGTSWNGIELQLDDAAEGKQAFVTGGDDDGTVGLDDVDGGVTSAISESISVPEDADVSLSFKYTFAHLDNSSEDDYFRVSVVSEDKTQVILEERGDASDVEGEWVDFSIALNDFAGEDIQLLVEAADNSGASLVEAGIDDVRIEIPETPTMIHEYSQGENGTVTLNEDGTLSYTPDEGFEGEDQFEYTLTDGENISNVATVTINVDARDFNVGSVAAGDEDSAIELKIESEYDSVKISGVPSDAKLSKGESLGNGAYELAAGDLEGLTITPPANSDLDFELTVVPGENGVYLDHLNETIEVIVDAVEDGATIDDFGILTGKKGALPLPINFFDNDGSESHQITFKGLPSFVQLSAGTQDGNTWTLSNDQLEDLEMASEKVGDTSDWSRYDSKYVYQDIEIGYSVETFELNGEGSSLVNDTFNLRVWQKSKK
jgi:hypothetical protein